MELEGENKFFREDKNMSEISSNSALNSYAADYSYRTEHNKKTDSNKKADVTKEADRTTKKSKVSGRTIGDPVLSDKAQKYYEKLKAKYQPDFDALNFAPVIVLLSNIPVKSQKHQTVRLSDSKAKRAEKKAVLRKNSGKTAPSKMAERR